ncbi:MAG: DUF2867 domain-containing protein, partial [Rhodanobacter sp.]
SLHSLLCKSVRCVVGLVRGAATSWRRSSGFAGHSGGNLAITELSDLPEGSMLAQQLTDRRHHHQDVFQLTLSNNEVPGTSATLLLSRLLDGFVQNPPSGVSRLMALRNVLVRPLGLRTSSLGCPVSSLLSSMGENRFAQRHLVLDQSIDADDRRAQVILGANDKHLMFRSCVGVQWLADNRVAITLGTRVHCSNGFGRIYMAAIQRLHRGYMAPAILRAAAEHAFPARLTAANPQHAPRPLRGTTG